MTRASRPSCLACLAGLAASALLAACGDTTTLPLTLLNLDRPVDVSFACYGGMRLTKGSANADATQPLVQTAMPTAACDALSPTLTPRANRDPMDPMDPGTGTEVAPVPVPGQGPVDMRTPVPAWYAFILQSSSGTVAVATWVARSSEKMTGGVSDQGGDFSVLDADPLTPGKNAISIGEDPVAIITDKAGCFEVTANAGSCDLSELEINSALDDISRLAAPTGSPLRIDRVSVKNRAGVTLLARPSAMIAEPGRQDVGNYCPGLDPDTGAGTATPSGKVYIAYPSCHLVAGVDLAKGGEIFSAISFDATGTASVLTGAALDNVSCPVECSNGKTPLGAVTPGPRPVALDFKLDTRVDPDPMNHPNSKPAVTQRLAIGAEKLAKITVANLDLGTFEALPQVLQVPLEDRPAPAAPLDISAVALSTQIGMGGDASAVGQQGLTDNTTVDRQAQFVYAVASDGTVRVADVLNLKHECDTQIDGRFLRFNATAPKDVPSTMCIDNTAKTMPREVGARGPGIALPDHGIPTSVAIFHPRKIPPRHIDPMTGAATTDFEPAGPSTLVGHFATITAASGTVFVVNIDDDYVGDKVSASAPVASQPVLVMAHQLRDNFFNRDAVPLSVPKEGEVPVPLCLAIDPSGGGHAGGPRLSAAPAQTSPTGTLSADYNPALPRFHDSRCTSSSDAPAPNGVPISDLAIGATRTTRDASYPDLKSIASETWTMTYEGTLSLDNAVTSVDGPTIREATISVDGRGMHLVDQTAPFCEMGVEAFDVVDLRGCDPSHGNGDCPADYQCYVHPKSNVNIGACLLKSEAQRLTETCKDFLTTQRRYTVGEIRAGQVQLLECKHELPMTPVDGCTSPEQCSAIADVMYKNNPLEADLYRIDSQHPPAATWSCENDPLRKPVESGSRCVQTCGNDPGHPPCAKGSICRIANPNDPPAMQAGVCMEGVEPPQSCLNGPQRFDVRASEAFAIIGQRSGFIHPWIKNNGIDATKPADACIRDPKASPLQIGRIPLKAPPCTGSPAPNPCEDDTTVMQAEFVPVYKMPPPENPNEACVKVEDSLQDTRIAPAIKISNPAMSLTLVDPTYPGDGRCFLDRKGTLGKVPFAVTGYRIEFEQKAGYEPFQLQLFGLVTPVKVVHGPSESIWVIDNGDFISTSITQASTRGRVFRIESSDLVGNTLQ